MFVLVCSQYVLFRLCVVEFMRDEFIFVNLDGGVAVFLWVRAVRGVP